MAARPRFRLQLRLDCLMVMGVGAGGLHPQDLTLRYLADKHHMAAQVEFFLHFAAEHGIGVFRKIHQAVFAAAKGCKMGKFVGFPTGLHTKMADGFKGNVLGQDTHIEFPGIFNDFPGQVLHLYGHRQSGGITSHLDTCVGNTTVVEIFLTCQHKQAVGKVS